MLSVPFISRTWQGWSARVWARLAAPASSNPACVCATVLLWMQVDTASQFGLVESGYEAPAMQKGCGMSQTNPHQHNPALNGLEALEGDWETEISNTSFLPNPSDTARGSVSFAWAPDDAFLMMRSMGDRQPSPPTALLMIGRDDASPDYTVLYYDSRRVSRVYAMSFADGVWKMWREAPGFWQRFEGAVSKDGKTIAAHWDKSSDGATWEHDFDLTYTKVS
jgi:hypothetical protein